MGEPYEWLYFDNQKDIKDILTEFSYRIDYQYNFLKDYYNSKNSDVHSMDHFVD